MHLDIILLALLAAIAGWTEVDKMSKLTETRLMLGAIPLSKSSHLPVTEAGASANPVA
jgi:hypothetical protein